MSICQVTIRKLLLFKIHFSIITIYPALVGLPLSIIISLILQFTQMYHINLINKNNNNELYKQLMFSSISGLSGTCALIFLNLALKNEDATKIGMIKTSGVLFSFILQYFLLNIHIDYIGLIGAVCLVSSSISIMIFKLNQNSLINSKNCFFKSF
jgi:drug/metabolite transporter (DMT)-like permease